MNKDFPFVNYHRHDNRCNIPTGADSCLNTADYINRANELGHKALSSCNHGYPSSQFEVYDGCFNKKGEQIFHYVFAVEGYFVLDTDTKDRTNAHIVFIARNNEGRRNINRLISDIAYDENGVYYGRPRTTLDRILELNPENVMITTACMFGIWKYENYEEILMKLHNHFGGSLYLEYQAHIKPEQIEINRKIQRYSKEYGINTIIGCDTHVIYKERNGDRPNGIENREAILRSRKNDDDEFGWFMDYPSSEEIFDRFEEQGVLSEEEIYIALNNTNIMMEFDVSISKNRKMPTLYPELPQAEINEKYENLVNDLWENKKNEVPKNTWKEHLSEFKEETGIITESNTSDYFLFNYEMIKLGIEKGGMITPTGRGSGVSWLSNWLLNFTKLNRLLNPVTMYKERFLTLTRAKTQLPDIDFNVSDPNFFAEAQVELLGESHARPMIAIGRWQEKSAFKMLARSEDIDPKVANEISKRITQWEEKRKYNKIEDDEGNEINDPSILVEDFIGEEYLDIFNRSKKYQKIAENIKQSPCSYVLYTQGDIEDEISLIRIKGKQGKPDVICANIEGAVAEKYGYVKNDILTVKVVPLIYKSWERAGQDMVDAQTLYKMCDGDSKTWGIYEKGLTLGINQYEKKGTASKAMRYKPKNIVESSLFSGAIRPGFKSNIEKFLNREEYDYGVPVFDNLIQTPEMPYTYLLFQEFLMKAFNFAGVALEKTVDVVKAISKKEIDKIEIEKEQFYNGFMRKIMEGGKTKDESKEIVDKIWKIVYDSGAYLFNSSHSVSTATDSLYSARIKAHHPLAFYETMLSIEKDKNKVSAIKEEMKKGFGIKTESFKFGNDNRKYTLDKENNSIHPELNGIKDMNQITAEILYELSKSIKDRNVESLIEIMEYRNPDSNKIVLDKTKLEKLCKIGYFSDWAKTRKIIEFVKIYKVINKNKTIGKKDINKTVEKAILNSEYYEDIEIKDKRIKNELLESHMEVIKRSPKTSIVNYTEKVKKFKICDESNSRYENIDKKMLFNEIWKLIPNDSYQLIPTIQNELSVLGYIQTEIPIGSIIINIGFSGTSKNGNEGSWGKSARNGFEGWLTYKKGLRLPPPESIIYVWDSEVKQYKKDGEIRNKYIIKEYNVIYVENDSNL